MKRVTPRWTVNKRGTHWCVYDRHILWDRFDTLADAHTAATQNAVADTFYAPGGLTLLTHLKHCADHQAGV